MAYLSGKVVDIASPILCATLLLAPVLNHRAGEPVCRNFSNDLCKAACRVFGFVILKISHALIAVLFFSMKVVLNFSSNWGLFAVGILISVCTPQLLVD